MLNRSRSRLVVCVGAVAALALAASFLARAGPAGELAEPRTATTTVANNLAPGQLVSFGFGGFQAVGDRAVTLTAGELVGVPGTVRVEEFYAIDARGVSGIGTFRGKLPSSYRRHRIKGIVLVPGRVSPWQIIATLSSTTPGLHQVRGLRLSYKSGRKSGSRTYRFRVRLNVVGGAS